MWIFSYAMLMVKADFDYEQTAIGKIKGFTRRFYQLSIRERGTETVPGRIATLIPEKDRVVWGVAYKLNTSTSTRVVRKLMGNDNDGFIQIYVKFYPINYKSKFFALSREERLNHYLKVFDEKSDSAGPSSIKRESSMKFHARKSESKTGIKRDEERKSAGKIRSAVSLDDGHAREPDGSEEDLKRQRSRLNISRENFSPVKLKVPGSKLERESTALSSIYRSSSTIEPTLPASSLSLTNQEFPEENLTEPFECLTFIATSDNIMYSVEMDLNNIARQIAMAKGTEGTNAEYVFKIAKTSRQLFPHFDDDHLFELEQLLRIQLDNLPPQNKERVSEAKENFLEK